MTLESPVAIHLEDHLESARVESAEPPTTVPNQVVWNFADGRASWQALRTPHPVSDEARSGSTTLSRETDLVRVVDALRLRIRDGSRLGDALVGGVYTELDDWSFDDWGTVVVRARTTDVVRGMVVLFELDDDVVPAGALSQLVNLFQVSPVFTDGSEATYVFPVRRPDALREHAAWTLSLVNTRRPVKSRTYIPLEFRA